MRPLIPLLSVAALLASAFAAPASAREIVQASDPEKLSVTIYRDPNRGPEEDWNRNDPRGFAMISEDRVVTLPPGESTIRFEGVAEGMVAVSAIVTGLPGGTIEKNRNADLLSPAALVDGTLGNRVTITRTNPATGVTTSQQAIVRTRADGGLVLQTGDRYEAVRCSGIPERLGFDRAPDGLSAKPIFSIDTRDDTGGTYNVRLTYLSWGFDWQANYVATLPDPGSNGRTQPGPNAGKTKLTAWLTLLNDNGQSFENAELMAVAGTVNLVSDFEELSDPPTARALRLTCYPLGSTAAGSPIPYYANPPSAIPPPMSASAQMMSISVTGSRRDRRMMESAADVAVVAGEEQLGDLKLYRFPEPVTVSAKGQKQVAFLQRDDVDADHLYFAECDAYEEDSEFYAAAILLVTKNVKRRGLGVALPQGGLAIFEPSPAGEQLVAEQSLRDYPVGQDIELVLGDSQQVFQRCRRITEEDPEDRAPKFSHMESELTNANPHPVRVRVELGRAADWDVRAISGVTTRFGYLIVERTIPANDSTTLRWRIRPST